MPSLRVCVSEWKLSSSTHSQMALKQIRADCHRLLNEIVEWAEQQTRQSRLRRTWRKGDDLDDLGKWRQRLDDVYQSFMVCLIFSLITVFYDGA